MSIDLSRNLYDAITSPLECTARVIMSFGGRPSGTIFDSDAIRCGRFVEVMILLLRMRTLYSTETDGIAEFVAKCAPYFNKRIDDIPRETVFELYNTFETLIEGY